MTDGNWGDFLSDTSQAGAGSPEPAAGTSEQPAPDRPAPDQPFPEPALTSEPGDGHHASGDAADPSAAPAAGPTSSETAATAAAAATAATEPHDGGATEADGSSTTAPDPDAATWESWSQADAAQAEALSQVASEHLEAASEWAAYGNLDQAQEEMAQAETAVEMAQMETTMAYMEHHMAESGWQPEQSPGDSQPDDATPPDEPKPEPDYSSGSDEQEHHHPGEPF